MIAHDAAGREITGERATAMIERRKSKAAGRRYYFGSACHCGCTLRYVKGGNCVRCKRAYAAQARL